MLIKEIQHHFVIEKSDFPRYPWTIKDSNGIGYSFYEKKSEAKAMRRQLVRVCHLLVNETNIDLEKVLAKLGTWDWEQYEVSELESDKPSEEVIDRNVRKPEMEEKTTFMPGGQMVTVSVPKAA